MHITQLLLCPVLANLPAGHAVQALAAPVEKVPAVHPRHGSSLLAPVAVANVPGLHGWHEEGGCMASPLLYVPGQQEVQALPPEPDEKLPLTHPLHAAAVSAPRVELYVPAPHLLHPLCPVCAWYPPAGHWLQSVDPLPLGRGLYVPTLHGVHPNSSIPTLKVPAGHSRHSVWLLGSGLNEPGGHPRYPHPPSVVWPESVLFVPAGHSRHPLLPASGW